MENIVKKEQLYEGKAKKVFATSDPDLVIVDYKDDATAGDGAKKGTIKGKGVINNQMTNYMFKMLEKEGVRPDVIIVDPPRKGCEEGLLHTISDMAPERIVYVSCDPGTLARDLSILEELGYKTEQVCPYDMFPRTVHVETVVLMSRGKE